MLHTSLFVLCLFLSTVAPADHEHKIAIQCIADDQQTEIYLNCQDSGLVNILSAEVGNQEVPQDKLICVPMVSDTCMLPLHDVRPLFSECMGLASCHKIIDYPEHDRCGSLINYVQVEYECIPVLKPDVYAVVDICGTSLASTSSLIRSHGYIQSLHYPYSYVPDSSCTCNLTALDPSTNIRLRVLDIDLSTDQRITMGHDWLEFTQNNENWGDGQKLNHLERGDEVNTSSATIFLNFRTDAGDNGRGFWLQYRGVAWNGADADIKIQCGPYRPADFKTDRSCHGESRVGELYMTCQTQGVINILSAVKGYTLSSSNENCSSFLTDNCTKSVTQDDELLKTCMGHRECNPPARADRLDCGRPSNYMKVLYQCIEENELGAFARVDICGDMTQTHTITRNMGYLETLNYPDGYFPSQRCTCRLQAVEKDTEIVLSLVDLDLDNKECTQTMDWIEFTSGKQNWAKGVRLCGNVPGEPIHTGAKKLYLNFYSDDVTQGRGVWLRYMGKKSDGTLTALRITCGRYVPGQDLPEDTINKETINTGHPNTQMVQQRNNAGLIAGLTITALFMLVATAAMLAYKYKRLQKPADTNDTAPGGPPSAIAKLDTGYGTLKYPGFSTKKNGHGMSYTNLDEDISRSGSLRQNGIRNTSPNISKTLVPNTENMSPKYSSSGSSTSCSSEPTSMRSEVAYNNPAFEGNWERDRDHDFLGNTKNAQA